MGIAQKGTLSGITGKVGTVVGGKRRGKEYMRSKPTRNKNPKKSTPQLQVQAKFTLAMQFAHGMKNHLDIASNIYLAEITII